MHVNPVFSALERIFYWGADIAAIIFSCFMVVAVSQRPQGKIHLSWLIPGLIGGCITLVYRCVVNVRFFLGIPWTPLLYYGTFCFGMLATPVYFFSSWKLLRTLQILYKKSSGSIAGEEEASALPVGNPWSH